MRCNKCGCTVHEAAERGAFFSRVNEKGVAGIFECNPSCTSKTGDQETALLAALGENEKETS